MPYNYFNLIKFQGHTGQKIADFQPNETFRDSNSKFISPITTELYIKIEVV